LWEKILKNLLLGPHLSIADGFEELFLRADEVNASAIQIFLKSNRSWHGPSLTEQDAKSFFSAKKKSGVKTVVVHAGYLINLASGDKETVKKSIDSLLDELQRCEMLQIPYLVLHPGSHTTLQREDGLKQFAESLNYVLAQTQNKTTIIAIENMAGQGTSIGTTFEELSLILSMIKYKKRIGICLDTCHLFVFGYQFATEKQLNLLLDEFDKTCGLDLLKVIHLNDSKHDLLSRKDRHENIGRGKIGLLSLKRLLHYKKLSHLPFILETPDTDGYKTYGPEIASLN